MKAARMEIVSAKALLHEPGILSLLACSIYMPTPEKLETLADTVSSDPAVSAYACYINSAPRGVIVLRRIGDDAEITQIAVDPAHRNRGIASGLISFAATTLAPRRIIAETDDDAVGFYRKAGFCVASLCEQYPGIVRYRCSLQLP